MRAWQIYHDGNSLQLQWATNCASETVPVQRICSVTAKHLMLLTVDECLYSAHLAADCQTLSLKLEREQVFDVDYCAKLQQLYVVTNDGLVLRRTHRQNADEANFGEWLTLSFDPLEISEEGIRIRRVCCSNYGALFVTHTNEIYVLGNCGDIFSTELTQPKHARLYDEHAVEEVLDLAAGEEFFILLLRMAYDEKADPLDLHVQNGFVGATTSEAHSRTELPKRQRTPETDDLNKQLRQDFNSNSSLHSYSDSSTKSSHASHEFESSVDVTQQLLRQGNALLHTQVHSFGSENNGILGTGDHIKRSSINHIKKLDSLGVCSIAAGCEHSLARTLDGRLYHWGLNTKQQLLINGQLQDLSAPTEFDFSAISTNELNAEQRRILAICCGDYKTVLLNVQNELITQNGKLAQNEKNAKISNNAISSYKEQELLTLQLGSRRDLSLLLAAGEFTVHNQSQIRQQYHASYALLQMHLKQLLKSFNTLQLLHKFQQRKSGTAQAIKQLQPICLAFRKLLNIIALIVKSFESFYRGDLESANDLIFIKHYRECITLFEAYTRTNCDVYSIDGYTDASKILTHYANVTQLGEQQQQQPQTAIATSTRASSSEFDLAYIFQQPLQIVSAFLQFLEKLAKTQHEYTEHLLAWQAYARKNTIDLELAENTHDFWQRNERNMKIRHFRRRHRRVILTSTSVPLKLSQHGISISTPTFILFSDFLCQLGGQLQTYPLVAMWIKIESDTALRITTPEKSFMLTARSHPDKMLWYDQLESSILAALLLPQGSKLSSVRTTSYVFSNNHAKYANVHAHGRWRNGVLHGSCYLEFPDGRFYYGEMRNGEIEGYGRMVIPSVGFYEGTFKSGKFNGQGTYEMKDNEVYEGNFRDGMFHGHGLLRSNNYTYIGEYQANAKSGYGVLDDVKSGDKYMGMFADNKRVGAGTCITMTGDYFEGIFANDELAGSGIAVFENDYYYVGELGMHGPCGKGTYFMPSGIVENEDSSINNDDDISNCVFVGNIVSGQLSGNWKDVRVVSGNVAINRQFPKYPKSIGELVIDDNRKWRSLFENFEEQIFGTTTNTLLPSTTSATNTIKLVWNHIAIFMTTQREREKAAEQQDTLSEPARHSYFAHNISMRFTNRNFDRLSLKSSNSLMTEATVFDFRSTNSRYIKVDAAPKRSHSQDTLYDDANLDLNELDYYQQHNDDFHSLSGYFNPQLANWANDTMNGIGMGGMGTSTPSLRSSYDSIFNLNGSFNNSISSTNCSQNALEYVPSFGITTLNESDVVAIKEYLTQAFKDHHHPLYLLNQRVANCFYISYGCWKVKPTPILAKQAMHEWETICKQIYKFVRKLFPALPEDYCIIESTREVISHITLLYPIVLTEGIYSTLFVLYANKYSRKDELYRQNLINAEKLSDQELATKLGLECGLLNVLSTSLFAEAIQTLKQLQEKYSPKAMLSVIEQCMQLITDAPKLLENSQTVIIAADSMMPLTLFLILRAAVPHLGAELALLDDLTGGDNFQFEMNGIAGYCYTTLKAAYEHITAKPLHSKTS